MQGVVPNYVCHAEMLCLTNAAGRSWNWGRRSKLEPSAANWPLGLTRWAWKEHRNGKRVLPACSGSRPFRTNVPIQGSSAIQRSNSTHQITDSEFAIGTVDDTGNLTSTQLPLKVTYGIIVESLGYLHEDPANEKYWSESRCGHRHPFPVGYTATKTYKGLKFRQTIKQGDEGPEFVVGEIGKSAYSADSPSKAWALALVHAGLNAQIRIHGRKHFGFDCPEVLQLLSIMEKEKGSRKQSADTVKLNLKTKKTNATREYSTVQKDQKDEEKYNLSATLREEITSPYAKERELQKQSSLTVPIRVHAERSTHSIFRERSLPRDLLRLRSEVLTNASSQNVQVVPCLLQESTFSSFSGVSLLQGQEEISENVGDKLHGELPWDDLKDSIRINYNKVTSDFGSPQMSNIEFAGLESKHTAKETFQLSNFASGDSSSESEELAIAKDEKARESSRHEKAVVSPGGEYIKKQKDSFTRLFHTSVHRSQISLENAVSKESRRDTVGSRSLANLLEDWNRVGQSRSKRNTTLYGSGTEKNSPRFEPSTVDADSSTDMRFSVETNDVMEENFAAGTGSYRVSPDLLQYINNGNQGRIGESNPSVIRDVEDIEVHHVVNGEVNVIKEETSNGAYGGGRHSELFLFQLDDWQNQAVEQANKSSILLCAPGGAGKSVVAARCTCEALRKSERSLFVTPSENLLEGHLAHYQKMFGSEYVGVLGSEMQSPSAILVTTLKTLVKVLREGNRDTEGGKGSLLEGIMLVVMDKFNTLGDVKYGSMWEEAIILLAHKIKLVALSLPLENAQDIVHWIHSIHGQCKLISSGSDPVPRFHYYCDPLGLYPLVTDSKLETVSKLFSHTSENSLHTKESDMLSTSKLSLRSLLLSEQCEELFPMAITIAGIDDCLPYMKFSTQLIQTRRENGVHVTLIENRIQEFLRDNTQVQSMITEDVRSCLLEGVTFIHDGQHLAWLEFVKGLVRDNLVNIVVVTHPMMCSSNISVRTLVYLLQDIVLRNDQECTSRSQMLVLGGTYGRRELDSAGKLIFVANEHSKQQDAEILASMTSMGTVSSHFKPTYSLLLNLLSKHTVPEVRSIIESSFSSYLEKPLLKEELRKKNTSNALKLRDAVIFTQVDVTAGSTCDPWASGVLPGVLFAVVPGPSEALYMILCTDNYFRLVPACALANVYNEEARLDATYKEVTGKILQVPALPSREKWKIIRADYLAYISKGTPKSSYIVEVLKKHGIHTKGEALRGTTVWNQCQQMIDVLIKADTLEFPSGPAHARLKPLGILVSRLHHVENELWFAKALTSSAFKLLTAPELAAVCSAFVTNNTQQSDPNAEPEQNDQVISSRNTPRRLRAALRTLESLRLQVTELQGSDTPPLCLDGSFAPMVHSMARKTTGQDQLLSVRNQMMSVVDKTIRLLHLLDNTCSLSTQELSALGANPGLHNRARRAAHLLMTKLLSSSFPLFL